MGMYDDLLTEKSAGGLLADLEKIEPAEAKQLKKSYPNLPEDYLAFLKEIGSGEFSDSTYTIYSGLLEPDEIYDDEAASQMEGVLIFGDDMQGYCSGFNANDGWSIFEIDPTDMSQSKISEKFSTFIRDRVKGS